MKKTKIIATVGPAIDSIDILKKLIKEGVDIFRINLSHGNLAQNLKWVEKIRKASKNIREVAIMIDTRGPEIRISETTQERIYLKKGDIIKIKEGNKKSSKDLIYINYPIQKHVSLNTKILLNDGKVAAKIINVDKSFVEAKIIKEGWIATRKKFTIYKEKINLPYITDDDERDIKEFLKKDIDFIALSFCQDAESIFKLKELIKENNANALIIAKVENYLGLKNIDEILKIADGVMVARGDLGVELPYEKIPIEQKTIINKANIFAKPAITATEMLESMIENSRPTRAETTDIANAILDGSDAIMLSAETSVGKYPIEAVKAMKEVSINSEKTLQKQYSIKIEDIRKNIYNIEDSIGFSIFNFAKDFNIKAIILINPDFYKLIHITKYRPQADIYLISNEIKLIRQSNILFSVKPIYLEDLRKDNILKYLKDKKLLKNGDFVLINENYQIKVEFIAKLLVKGISYNNALCKKGPFVIIKNKEDIKNKKYKGFIIEKGLNQEIKNIAFFIAKERQIPLIEITKNQLNFVNDKINNIAIFNDRIYEL